MAWTWRAPRPPRLCMHLLGLLLAHEPGVEVHEVHLRCGSRLFRSSAATTHESTPPEIRRTTVRSPTARAQLLALLEREKLCMFQSPRAPQMSRTNASQDLHAVLAVAGLGVELDAPEAFRVVHECRGDAVLRFADDAEPVGVTRDGIAMAHPGEKECSGTREKSWARSSSAMRARPYSLRPRDGHAPPVIDAHPLQAVADPQDAVCPPRRCVCRPTGEPCLVDGVGRSREDDAPCAEARSISPMSASPRTISL